MLSYSRSIGNFQCINIMLRNRYYLSVRLL